MIKYYFNKPIYSLLLVLIFLTSCNGQTKTQSPAVKISQPATTSIGQPKLIKTQGSIESDNVWCGLQDKEGNLWLGTTGEGVYRYTMSMQIL